MITYSPGDYLYGLKDGREFSCSHCEHVNCQYCAQHCYDTIKFLNQEGKEVNNMPKLYKRFRFSDSQGHKVVVAVEDGYNNEARAREVAAQVLTSQGFSSKVTLTVVKVWNGELKQFRSPDGRETIAKCETDALINLGYDPNAGSATVNPSSLTNQGVQYPDLYV